MRSIEIDIAPKKNYLPVYKQKSRYKLLWGGRGRGGSHEATLYSFFRLTSPEYYRIAFLRLVFRDNRNSIWLEFKDRIEQSDQPETDFHLIDTEMKAEYLPTGNTVTCFGVKSDGGRTAKLKSLAGFNLLVIEEADELSEMEFDMIDSSLRTVREGISPEIILVFNPPPLGHWIWKRWFIPVESDVKGYWRMIPKENIDFISIFSDYHGNELFIDSRTKELYERYRFTNEDYYWTMIRGLVSEGLVGRVFKNWQQITNQAFTEIDARSIFGLDFGTSSPAGLVEMKFVKNDIYIREQNYLPLTVKEIAIHLCKMGLTTKELIIADAAEPHTIAKLRRGWDRSELSEEEITKWPMLLKGFNIYAAIKGPGSIKLGIDLIKDSNVFVTTESVNLWKEYTSYRYALDKNKNPTDEPEDANNHCFAGETQIETIVGRRKIKDILPGELVLTRRGYRKVLIKFINGHLEVCTYCINFDNQQINITCTPDHKIHTQQNGWIPIALLKPGMTVTLSRNSRASDSTYMQNKNILPEGPPRCIEKFTGSILENQKKVFMSIIKMRIASIITYLILGYFKVKNISLYTWERLISVFWFRGWIMPESLQTNGMGLLQVESNTGSKLSILNSEIPICPKEFAIVAGSYTSPQTISPDFATITVNQISEENQELITLNLNAKNVGMDLSETNTIEEKTVTSVIQSEVKRELVFDLMVDESHEYFANDLLVHNCIDPIRYVRLAKGRLF